MIETIERPQDVRNGIHHDFRESVSAHLRMSGEKPHVHIVQDQKLFVTTALYKVLRPLDDDEDTEPDSFTDVDEVEFKRFVQLSTDTNSSTKEHGYAIILRSKEGTSHTELRSHPRYSDQDSFSITLGKDHHITPDTTYAEESVSTVNFLNAEGLLQLVPSVQARINR